MLGTEKLVADNSHLSSLSPVALLAAPLELWFMNPL